MKKLLIFFILLNSLCHARNHQCIQSVVKRYFTNGNGIDNIDVRKFLKE